MTSKEMAIGLMVIASMIFTSVVLVKVGHEAKAEPVPTEATALMIETFQETAEKLNTQLARCMSLIEICERSRLTFDAQMAAVFKVNKEVLCK